MVKRYNSPRQKAKLLKEMPFYYRYPKQTITVAIFLPLIYVFGPIVYRFFFPPPEGKIYAIDPRREENMSKLRLKYLEREESLKNMNYFEDKKKS